MTYKIILVHPFSKLNKTRTCISGVIHFFPGVSRSAAAMLCFCKVACTEMGADCIAQCWWSPFWPISTLSSLPGPLLFQLPSPGGPFPSSSAWAPWSGPKCEALSLTFKSLSFWSEIFSVLHNPRNWSISSFPDWPQSLLSCATNNF